MPKAPRAPKNFALQTHLAGKPSRGVKSSSSQGRDQWAAAKSEESGKQDGQFCPLCIEPLDSTEQDFYPCPCGYQVCLFCYDKLRNECNKMCPGCRQTYDEDPSVNHPPPPRPLQEPSGLSKPKMYDSSASQDIIPRNEKPLSFLSNRMESWNQNSNEINKALSDKSSVYKPVQSSQAGNVIPHNSLFLIQSESPPLFPVLGERQKQDKKQTLDSWQATAVVPTASHLQRRLITSQDYGASSSQIESRSKNKQEIEVSTGNNSNYANKNAAGNPIVPKPNLDVSNFLSMLKSSSEKNIGIKLDANMASVPPPPGFGPPGFTTPQRATYKDPNFLQTTIPKVTLGQQSNLITPAQRPSPILTVQPAPSKYNSNPLGVIGSSSLVRDVKNSNWRDKLYNQRQNPAVTPLGRSSGSILTQLQALWKDEGTLLGSSSNTSNLPINNGVGRSLDNQGSSLFSGGLCAPMATSSMVNSSLCQQQPQLVSHGSNFGVDRESNKNSLMWGSIQLQRNGVRQQYPTNMESLISGSQLTNNMSQVNNNPLQDGTNYFLNQSILDNVGNNTLSIQQLLHGNTQLSNNLERANLGQNRNGEVLQLSLQRQSQQTNDINVLFQQLQQRGNSSNGGEGSNSGNGGLQQNFPTV
eukprot:TRINITY_DN7755_c0_g3_i2.p1 TRINITY_DN7755_c0_g3~~TRINITY_DN7755_c0_g3_i2.p1  ORF type:complete len:639 (-),score=47.15 TRINITY_DN7755_c0_g3_i2:256-2172(-)